jgi:hypothetical protein
MRFPDISKRPWQNIDIMIAGALDIACGLARVLSLGYWTPEWTIDYLFWRSMKMLDTHQKPV